MCQYIQVVACGKSVADLFLLSKKGLFENVMKHKGFRRKEIDS